MNEELLDMIVRSAAVPTVPLVATRFLEISSEEDVKTNDLVAVLNTDPGIAGELLRLTNSSLFGVRRQVTSLQQALTLLGMKRVRSLVLGRYLAEGVNDEKKRPQTFSLSYYWRRSLAAAVLAARFAGHIASKHQEEAFLAGLLSDIGIVVMNEALGAEYAPIVAHFAPMCADSYADEERAAFDLTHADVSALVLDKWMLPSLIVEAVRRHHDYPLDDSVDSEVAVLARIVNGAGIVAKALGERPDPEHVTATCRRAMDIVGLNLGALQRALQDIEPQIEEFAKLLNTDIVQSSIYERISKIITDGLAADDGRNLHTETVS